MPIQRYYLSSYTSFGSPIVDAEEDPDGEWVKFADVEDEADIADSKIALLEVALRYWMPQALDGVSVAAEEYERWQHDMKLLGSL